VVAAEVVEPGQDRGTYGRSSPHKEEGGERGQRGYRGAAAEARRRRMAKKIECSHW